MQRRREWTEGKPEGARARHGVSRGRPVGRLKLTSSGRTGCTYNYFSATTTLFPVRKTLVPPPRAPCLASMATRRCGTRLWRAAWTAA
mgnify:CR=1 FL=1